MNWFYYISRTITYDRRLVVRVRRVACFSAQEFHDLLTKWNHYGSRTDLPRYSYSPDTMRKPEHITVEFPAQGQTEDVELVSDTLMGNSEVAA